MSNGNNGKNWRSRILCGVLAAVLLLGLVSSALIILLGK